MSDVPEGLAPADDADLGAINPDEPELETEAEPDEPVAGDEEEGEPGIADEEQPPPANTRRGREYRLAEKARKLEQELAEARGFRQAVEQQRVAQPQPQIDQQAQLRALQERWSQMAPADAMIEMYQYGQQQFQQALQVQQYQTNDRIDRQAYDAAAARSPVHQKHQPEVERLLADERARGNYAITRENILIHLLGQEALRRTSQVAPRQRAAAGARVAAQQTRPGGARSDGGSGGRRPADSTPERDAELINEFFNSGGRL